MQSNRSRNLYIFILENVFENVVREIGAILSQPQSVHRCHKLQVDGVCIEEYVALHGVMTSQW